MCQSMINLLKFTCEYYLSASLFNRTKKLLHLPPNLYILTIVTEYSREYKERTDEDPLTYPI